MFHHKSVLAFALLIALQVLKGQDLASADVQLGAPSLSEKTENLGLLYRDVKNPVLQEFWLLGRYHGHFHSTDGSKGSDEDWEDRRARFGFQSRLFNHFIFHAQVISGSDFNPVYNGFTELWARWEFNDALLLTIGQQKHRFTHERNLSSRYMSVIERGMFINMMRLDYTPAVTLSGRSGKLEYNIGIFTNSTDRNMWDSFTELDSGASGLAAITYDLEKFLGTDSAFLYGSYLHSDAKSNSTLLTRFDEAVSGALILTKNSLALISELTMGFGGTRGNATGLTIHPSFFITDQLELVGRYQIAASSDAVGLISQRRYESVAGLPNGDLYQAGYLGLNYYIANHRLKLMSGIEYANMEGEHTTTLFAGVRMFIGPQSNAPFPGNKMLKGLW